MYEHIKGHVLFLVSFLLTIHLTNACKGCIDLDEITFNNILPKFNYSLIKFDIAFPYGDKHEAYSQLALQLQTTLKVDGILFGTVGVKDYGDKDNSNIAAKYSIDEKSYPAILLFGDNLEKEIARFPASLDVTVDNLKIFLKENSKLYIGLSGCIYEFDQLANGFTTLSKLEQKTVISKAQELTKTKKDDTKYTTSANVYTLYMQKVMDKGESFLKDESERIEKLLKKGKISTNKRNELENKVNILKSFEKKNKKTKEEL